MKVRNEATVIAVTRMPNRLWHSPKLLPAKFCSFIDSSLYDLEGGATNLAGKGNHRTSDGARCRPFPAGREYAPRAVL